MSTWFYLQCENHDPPIRAARESGQHYRDLQQIFAALDNRDTVIRTWNCFATPRASFPWNTAKFIVTHPHCTITVQSETGQEITRDQAIKDGYYTPKETP